MKEEMFEKVVEVLKVSDDSCSFEEDVLRLISEYAPQSGRGLEEKQPFYDELKYEWDMHSADDLVMCSGD